jgi:hypothetical protein
MSAIFTTTQTSAASQTPQFSKEIGLKLIGILGKYPETVWKDDLSNRLRTWSIEFLKLMTETDSEGTLHKKIAVKVRILWDDILTNFINKKRLEKPYIDRDKWVWDKKYLDCYMNYNIKSPFDDCLINAKPHLFAQAIISWVKSVPVCFKLSESAAKEKTNTAIVLVDKEDLLEIDVCAKAEVERQEERARVRNLEQESNVKHEMEKIIAQFENELDATRKLHETTSAASNQKLEEANKQHKANMDKLEQLQTSLNGLKITLTVTNTQLNAVKHTANQQQVQVNHLQAQAQMLATSALRQQAMQAQMRSMFNK